MDASLQYTLFVILAPLVTLSTLGMFVYIRFFHATTKNSAFYWLLLSVSGWLIFNTLELVSNTEASTVFWTKISYGFIAFTPTVWLVFALQYTGHQKWVESPRLLLLSIIPLATTLIAWTNDLHHWLWTEYRFNPVNNMLALNVGYGPWFWVQAGVAYISLFLGAFLIVRQYFRSFKLYRQQSIWLVIGALTPSITNVIYIFHLFPGWQKDYTPISFALASAAFAVGMFRYRLFDLKPVARDALIDSMSDAMLAIDNEGRIVDINPAALAIMNTSANVVIGRPFREVLSPWRDIVERFQDQSHIESEITLQHDGDQRHFDLRISALTDPQQRPTGWLIVLRDITARKQAEAALQKHAAELEARNEELDAFAHTVAHDLKGPLSTVTGYSNLLKQHYHTLTREEADQSLDAISRTGVKMAHIIDELLLLAKVRQLDEVQIGPLDTDAIIAGTLERLQMLRTQTSANILVPTYWPVALGYEPWVEEVWANYISNALKYGGELPQVELGANKQTNASNGHTQPMVRFWVRDNGAGIPAEQQPRLFTTFTRLDSARAEGHGLGLSITQRIIKKLGGQVGVESQIGEGSLFWFTLPAYQE